ncbi:SoxR reducing system RseC family protein [Vibrio gallicus]|uniref:SoxR reducing system RseC family protein n=1 Tax=Vibrio gallicus TaxID=190897 RepID=UPI0021C3F570|nr:SoxR reducing system RseC family protein [Vibrio gallicus]
MMQALAVVTSVTPDPKNSANFLVGLSCEQQTSCNGCASKSHCATGQVTKAIGNRQHAWTLNTSHALSVGDVIEIGLPEKELLSVASIVYLVPLFGLMIGAAIGNWISNLMLGDVEWPSILLGVAGALVSGYVVKVYLQSSQADQKVTLVRALGQAVEVK